jgi:hypothetical protein
MREVLLSSDSAAPEDEREKLRREKRVRTLVVGAVGISIPIADVAFNLGAYGAVFYGRMITLWAVTTTTTLCLIALGGEQRRIGRVGLALMTIPTLAIAAQFSANQLLTETPVLRAVFVAVFLAAMVLAFPYTLYVVASIIDEDLLDLGDLRTKVALIIIAVVVGGTSFLVGVEQRFFLTCDDFEVSGNHVPADCRDEPSKFILP